MRERNNIIMEYGTYMLTFFASYIASLAGLHYLSGLVLMAEALFLYVHWVKESGSLVELRALFTLAWVGGQGIACLQLSKLQADWNYVTWLCFFLIFGGFGIGYEWGQKYEKVEEKELEKDEEQARRLLHCIIGLMAASILCFAFEAVKVGFIPLFSDEPHAYSYFHVSGVHYFTVSCILIPAITVLYIKVSTKIPAGNKMLLLAANVTAVMIPFLCVSRFQLLFAVGFAVVTYIMVNKKIRIRTMVILIVALVPVYVILTVFRHHDVSYLNSIFEMKWEKMPIFITQPYMYVANNFENFNCMVEQMTEHTWGIKMLFPFFALTGLKFVIPQVNITQIYLTKPELTTLTMFYDAYYDFGIFGVFFFAMLIGIVAKILMNVVKNSKNPTAYLFYGQIAIYLGLAFFTTWFSNPTTWFWLALTGMMHWYVGHVNRRKGMNKEDE
ncbi:MAG: oligosaccharide repeat unit polymerase [Dorea sp.]|uniref:O-antigen polymerase n=1 Tax=Dorea sp. YH-dor226 TaxID=3151119 RepID=UPI00306765F7|nr:oligosaccharide repeat unit polymerase [Dorea sp.]